MQFWRIKGYVSDEKWTQENDSRRILHERARKISSKADAFSQKQYGSCFVFLEEISENRVTAGVIVKNAADITDLAGAFFSAAGLEVGGTAAEEVTLKKMYHMLNVSDRNDYIPERYDVLEQFRIEDLEKTKE